MKYPKRNHYLVIRRTGRDTYGIRDILTDEEWTTGVDYARFLMALDGYTNPYKIDSSLEKRDVHWLLEDMESEGLLDTGSKVIYLGHGSVLVSLWEPNAKKIHRVLSRIWNRLLITLWLPLLVIGLYVLLSDSWEYVEKGWGTLSGYVLGLGLGLFMHEFSHAASALSYGGHFLEMGVMMHSFLPGAYVLIDYSELKNRFKRAQINAAGIECNIALCGIFLCALKLGVIDSAALIIAAVLNAILAFFNTSLINGIDGMGILGEVLGCEDLVEKAKNLIVNQNGKRLLRKRGINGRATIAACYIIVFLQLLLPIVLTMNVLSIIDIFI